MKSKKAKLYAIRCRRYVILAGCIAVIASGCENARKKMTPAEQIKLLTKEKKQLVNQIEQFETKNKQLKKQLQVLYGLEDKIELEDLYDLQRVKITRYTNLYDKDKDGQKEKLIVYIQPIDEDGDIIKAAGAVDVQLWDLNKKDGEALLGQWQVKPDELKKLWYATLITINYRLNFDVADKIDTFEEPLTVKVTFTDYLSGKVFNEQRVIKP